MSVIAVILVLAAVTGVAWRLAAAVLGLIAWVFLVAIMASILVGVAVPGTVVFVTATLWVGSQIVSRLRRGEWRSRALRGLAAGLSGLHAAG